MTKVMLVEDDNNLREIYEARLAAEGYTIVTAKDGEEALVVGKAEKPDLIISDVMMPKISGFEMLDILRNTEGLKDVKVIMLTALGQSDDQARADQLGADKYLVKSQVTLEDIVKVAHDLLEDAASPGTSVTPADNQDDPVVETAQPVVAETVAEPATPVAEAPTEQQEQTAVDAQVENFVAGAQGEPEALAVTTPESDKIMTDAVDNLLANTPAAEQPADPSLPAPEPAVPTANEEAIAAQPPASEDPTNTQINGKKTVAPLDAAEPKKSLDELLAIENAKEAQAAQVTEPVAPVTSATPDQAPVAAPEPAVPVAPAPAAPAATTDEPEDPSSIAL